MGKLITIVGNSGAGKTTLTHRICTAFHLVSALEQHAKRPFQQLFSEDLHRYSLGNQVDYLLLRAEQEWSMNAKDGRVIGNVLVLQDVHAAVFDIVIGYF